MKKLIKDMTPAEKQERIGHLSHKYYDINTTPSTILREEMQYTETDAHMLDMLKRMETMEIQRSTIDKECSAKLTSEMRVWKQVFESQNNELARKHEKQRLVPPFGRPGFYWNLKELEQVQKQEVAALQREQEKDRKKVRDIVMMKLDSFDNTMHSVFMEAVKYIYR